MATRCQGEGVPLASAADLLAGPEGTPLAASTCDSCGD